MVENILQKLNSVVNMPYKRDPMYAYLIVLTICSSAGLHCWQILFNNFSVDVVGLDGHHIGILQSVREIPGFLALLVTYVLLVIKEHRLAAFSIALLGGQGGLRPTTRLHTPSSAAPMRATVSMPILSAGPSPVGLPRPDCLMSIWLCL